MLINKNELTKEKVAKLMSCETVEELMAVAKSEGIELTKEEAEAYMSEIDNTNLPLEDIAKCVELPHATVEELARGRTA